MTIPADGRGRTSEKFLLSPYWMRKSYALGLENVPGSVNGGWLMPHGILWPSGDDVDA